MPIKIENIEPSEKMLTRIRAERDTVMLAFSAGKDAVLAWLALRDAGFNVIPYYCYLVPNLGFVEESLIYYEQFFKTKITRMPHPSLYRMWNNMVFMPPERCEIAEASSLPSFEFSDIEDGLREKFLLPKDTPTASGVRAADSIVRRVHFKRHGPFNSKAKKFYPVWDWTIAEIEQKFIADKVSLPVDYWIFGRSFDGVDFRFLKPIKKHFPSDYQKILECFPMAELELKREEFKQ